MGKPEGIIEDYLGGLCEKYDILYYKFNSDSQAGVPDRMLIFDGHIIFVELKRPIKYKSQGPRDLQKAVFKIMRDHGAVVLVIDTKSKCDKLIDSLVKKYHLTPKSSKKENHSDFFFTVMETN